MKKITSAYANKMLRSLEEDKAFWVNKEAASSTYVAAVNEEPVIPEYDYMTIANTIDEIDRKIVTIKHTLNLTNATAKVQVGNQEMSIDSILIRMAQLNKRKAVLDDMRKRLPKMRVYSNSFSSSGSVPEYKYINYDLEVIRQEYDRISNTIMEMSVEGISSPTLIDCWLWFNVIVYWLFVIRLCVLVHRNIFGKVYNLNF